MKQINCVRNKRIAWNKGISKYNEVKTIMIPCACGCSKLRPKYDDRGREKKFINWHRLKKENTLINCACGCGQELLKYDKWGNERKFINHHFSKISPPMLGKHHTKETIEKCRIANLGKKCSNETKIKISKSNKDSYENGTKIPYWLGKKFSEETKQKMRIKTLKRWQNKEFKDKFIKKMEKAWNNPNSIFNNIEWRNNFKEMIKKIGLKNKGKKLSSETRKKLSETKKRLYKEGKIFPLMLGKHHTEETKRKLSESHKGDKCHLWKGGISFEPYTPEFNNQLKEIIRKRDHYRCQECFREQDELRTSTNRKCKLAIHHIDFNKKNNNPSNLISLCRNCHSQTNFNREGWTQYFQNKMEDMK